MSTLGRTLLLATIVLILTSCFPYVRYSGDGHFVDNGWTNYSQRYVVDLESVDLTTAGTYTYRLSGLPRAQFVVGIDLVDNSLSKVGGTEPTNTVKVRLQLHSSGGRLVILEGGLPRIMG